MPVKALTFDEMTNIEPGIRKLIYFLRLLDFDTHTSGDGVNGYHDPEGQPPYVGIQVDIAELVHEANRLWKHLISAGVQMDSDVKEDGTGKCVEANYYPHDKRATLYVYNVLDTDLVNPDLNYMWEAMIKGGEFKGVRRPLTAPE